MLTKHVNCEIPESIIKSAQITANVYGYCLIILTVEQEGVGAGGQFLACRSTDHIGRAYKHVATITEN